MSLGKALVFVLEGADLKTAKRATAISGFFDAFEEGIRLFLYPTFLSY